MMKKKTLKDLDREYDFALIIGGVHDLNQSVEDALFEAGCDDATPSMQYGLLYLEFSRKASSLQSAVLSAIKDVRKAGIGAEVMRIDECNLVSQAEIARRIARSRQLIGQYISGERGPGGFPPPECHLTEGAPLWTWCAVSLWLAKNNIVRQEEGHKARVVHAINLLLETHRQQSENPKMIQEIDAGLAVLS